MVFIKDIINNPSQLMSPFDLFTNNKLFYLIILLLVAIYIIFIYNGSKNNYILSSFISSSKILLLLILTISILNGLQINNSQYKEFTDYGLNFILFTYLVPFIALIFGWDDPPILTTGLIDGFGMPTVTLFSNHES